MMTEREGQEMAERNLDDPRIAEVARMLWLDGYECGALDPDETREAAAKFSDVARRIIEWIDRHPKGAEVPS